MLLLLAAVGFPPHLIIVKLALLVDGERVGVVVLKVKAPNGSRKWSTDNFVGEAIFKHSPSKQDS